MVGESGRARNGTVHYYYKCSGAKRHEGCTRRKAIRKHPIERAVVYYTVSKVLQDDVIRRIADAILQIQKSEDTAIPALEAQLRNCEKGIENMVNAIQAGVLTSSTKERLDALEQRRDELKRPSPKHGWSGRNSPGNRSFNGSADSNTAVLTTRNIKRKSSTFF